METKPQNLEVNVYLNSIITSFLTGVGSRASFRNNTSIGVYRPIEPNTQKYLKNCQAFFKRGSSYYWEMHPIRYKVISHVISSKKVERSLETLRKKRNVDH